MSDDKPNFSQRGADYLESSVRLIDTYDKRRNRLREIHRQQGFLWEYSLYNQYDLADIKPSIEVWKWRTSPSEMTLKRALND